MNYFILRLKQTCAILKFPDCFLLGLFHRRKMSYLLENVINVSKIDCVGLKIICKNAQSTDEVLN